MHQEKKMLAHISEDGTRVQTVADHLQGTAVLCGQFAAAFDAQQQGTWLGLLHDIGKYSTKFQKRLQGGEKVDHSTAGAQVAARYGQIPLAFAIAGHHSGLPDGGGRSDTAQDATMFGRLKKSVEPYTQWTNEIKLPSIPPQPEMMKENRFTQAFYIRMLYSCLVDADYLDTENFMSSPKPRGQGQTMDELLKRLNQYTAKWSHPQGTLNQRRSSILSACTTAGQTGRRGLYSLTVPTGGGKTVASLAFALSLAVKNHMDRVIYVIPYTSIIDQTADVFSEILGAENVLEHHSGVDYSAKEDDEPAAYRKALAAENWDAPVVVTTSVLPDRIAAATYAAAAAIAGGRVTVTQCSPVWLAAFLDFLQGSGCEVARGENEFSITRDQDTKLRGGQELVAAAYPGLATDTAPLAAAVLLGAEGASRIYDGLFQNRFACAQGFAALGADARSEGRLLYLGGSAKLHGATVTAPDLRGGAALVLAGLGVGDGSCVRVLDAGHIRRGYADLAGDLRRLGADCRAGRTGTEAGRQTKKL